MVRGIGTRGWDFEDCDRWDSLRRWECVDKELDEGICHVVDGVWKLWPRQLVAREKRLGGA